MIAAYSNTIITDDNYDDELEKLAELIGVRLDTHEGFTDCLDERFEAQINEVGIEEWVKCGLYPSCGADCLQAYQRGQIAYEFGNGYMVFNFEVVL